MGLGTEFKQWLTRQAYKRHTLFDALGAGEDVRAFLKRFREKYVHVDLIRVGGDGDGGYLLPDNLADIDYCFSAGVDYVAGFEAELSKTYGIKSFMADASVAAPPVSDDNFTFVSKYLGARTHDHFVTLSDWVNQSIGEDDSQRILQMDIEGAEYEVLTYESADTMAQFSTIIIEFHNLQNIFEPNFFRMVSAVFEKLYENFSICHVHPNTCGHVAVLNGIAVPSVIEVTFLRHDLVDRSQSAGPVSLPHRLDRSNKPGFPDVAMPEIWWRSD